MPVRWRRRGGRLLSIAGSDPIWKLRRQAAPLRRSGFAYPFRRVERTLVRIQVSIQQTAHELHPDLVLRSTRILNGAGNADTATPGRHFYGQTTTMNRQIRAFSFLPRRPQKRDDPTLSPRGAVPSALHHRAAG